MRRTGKVEMMTTTFTQKRHSFVNGQPTYTVAPRSMHQIHRPPPMRANNGIAFQPILADSRRRQTFHDARVQSQRLFAQSRIDYQENLITQGRMGFHDGEFFGESLPGEQDVVGNANFTDVVHWSGIKQHCCCTSR